MRISSWVQSTAVPVYPPWGCAEALDSYGLVLGAGEPRWKSRVMGHNCSSAYSCQVCSARVDIRSGDLYWLACNRRDIGVIQASDMSPRILHRSYSSIQHLFLDWQQGTLYWLARGQPLQQLSLAGGAPRDAWNETWPGELPAVMDSRAVSLLWSSALGEPCWSGAGSGGGHYRHE